MVECSNLYYAHVCFVPSIVARVMVGWRSEHIAPSVLHSVSEEPCVLNGMDEREEAAVMSESDCRIMKLAETPELTSVETERKER